MPDPDDFFDDVYEMTSLDQAAAHYAKFAKDYEAAMASNGYITPKRCAEALAGAGADKTQPVLDVGCGSGLSGLALRAEGFATLDGTDYSEEMLAEARPKGIYRTLWQGDLSEPIPDRAEAYDAAVAAGVISPAHAPAQAIDNILSMLTQGGLFAFSLNDHALKDHSYEGRVHTLVDSGHADLVFREYGEHMPGQDLKAWVYVLKKR